MHARGSVEDGPQKVDNVSLLLAILIKALEQVRLVVTLEESFDLIYGTFRQLSHELPPVPMLDLKEPRQVVRLEEHQSYKAAIQLLVTLNLILELAALVPIKLLLVHRQGQPFDKRLEVGGKLQHTSTFLIR